MSGAAVEQMDRPTYWRDRYAEAIRERDAAVIVARRAASERDAALAVLRKVEELDREYAILPISIAEEIKAAKNWSGQ
jgi:hypothetical protein